MKKYSGTFLWADVVTTLQLTFKKCGGRVHRPGPACLPGDALLDDKIVKRRPLNTTTNAQGWEITYCITYVWVAGSVPRLSVPVAVRGPSVCGQGGGWGGGGYAITPWRRAQTWETICVSSPTQLTQHYVVPEHTPSQGGMSSTMDHPPCREQKP